MNFADKFTTSEFVAAEALLKPEDLPKNIILEKDKMVLSNDAYAIGQLLETLINTGAR